MVAGAGGAGYALQISNSNATVWGGLLMFYFISAVRAPPLERAGPARRGVFDQGRSPSGRFGVSLGMLDTTPVADNGLCDSPTVSDCKSATIEWKLPADAATWMQVQVPWSCSRPASAVRSRAYRSRDRTSRAS